MVGAKRLNDLVDTLNLVFCAFFGIDFIYSDNGLFVRLGGLFLLWTCFYVAYNRWRAN